jgi:RNA polymerase sigma factor (sigma-70 family)
VSVPTGTTDAGLIALIVSGDADALAELYDRYRAPSFGLARKVTRNTQLAEEVVQEAFLTVWRQAGRFDATRARVSTWLLTIIHNRAVDVVRREQLRRTEPEAAMQEADSTNVPHEAWLGLQTAQVREAVATLSSVQREVIELGYFSGYSQSELARRLDEPLGTIKSRTHTALGELRTQLDARGITLEDIWGSWSHAR